MPMLMISTRVVLALILMAAIPYALTIAAVVVMWLDETLRAIFGKSLVTRASRAARFAVSASVLRNSVETSGRTGIGRGFLEMKRLKMFDSSVSKSASWQELPVETGRERLTNLVGAPTILRRGRELSRSPQPDVLEKVRCVESIHHWHR
jgi:hypothetical protein